MILDATKQYTFTMVETSEDSSEETPFVSKKIEISIADNPSIDEILEAFEDFLQANGFRLAENEYVSIVREIKKESEDENDTKI